MIGDEQNFLPEPVKARSAAFTKDSRLQELMMVTEQLSGLLQEEMVLLKDRPTQLAERLSELQKHKSTMARIYEGHIEFMQTNPDFFVDADPNLREQLKGMGIRFAGIVKENARLLDIAYKTSQRLSNTIIAAIRQEANQFQPYGDPRLNNRSQRLSHYSLNSEI